VTFPEDYQAEHLAGKDAVFETEVKDVQAPGETKIDDAG
jgi:trigger factor